jgi:hypothetical protein
MGTTSVLTAIDTESVQIRVMARRSEGPRTTQGYPASQYRRMFDRDLLGVFQMRRLKDEQTNGLGRLCLQQIAFATKAVRDGADPQRQRSKL